MATHGALVETKRGKKPDKWEIESWTRTIIEAQEIMCDPEKMKYVKSELKMKKKAFKSIDDIIRYRNEKATSEKED
jgi:hypothetical protein